MPDGRIIRTIGEAAEYAKSTEEDRRHKAMAARREGGA